MAIEKDEFKLETNKLEDKELAGDLLFESEQKPVFQILRENPYLLGLACVCSIFFLTTRPNL